MQFRNVSEDICALAIAGPKAGELLTEVSGISHQEWKFLDCKEVRFKVDLEKFLTCLKG